MPSSSGLPQLWDGFRMSISPGAYVFEPTSKLASTSEVLVIDRNDSSIRVVKDGSAPNGDKTMSVQGIVGVIKLHSSEFLVVITSKKKVAEIAGADVYMATEFRTLPLDKEANPSLLKHPVEKTLLGLLKAHLYSAPFYFSYEYDLTSSMQRQALISNKSAPLWQRTDDRFFWNRFLMQKLVQATQTTGQDLSRFILPCVFGFLEVKEVKISNHAFVLGLIARRSRHRVGTRYFSRGIDLDGNVSNFNETEQFVITNRKGDATMTKANGTIRKSYVQTRGSVPVFWAEVNNLRYKPDLQIMEKPETAEATRKHFQDQVARYGDNYLVNLVNQKGYEKPVKEAYERAVEKLHNPQVHYTYYDFHHECKGMKFERVMDLIERLETKGLKSNDYFAAQDGEVISQQRSVVRTNCMDCLDRTNVVQGTLARWILNDQLGSIGILSGGDKVETQNEFMHVYRNVWADHADVISKAYSGTGALKTDFTRTGKRSKEGALQDGVNSVTRYIKNNYFDGARQDAYDLFTGAWEPSKGLPHPDQRALLVRAMPWVLLFALSMLFASLVLPRHTAAQTLASVGGGGAADALGKSSTLSHVYFFSLWLVVAMGAFQFMVSRGLNYVAWPTLNRPDETIFYDGPGFKSGAKGRSGAVNPFKGGAQMNPKGAVKAKAAPALEGAGRRGEGYSIPS
ncbi:probable SAC1 - recessive suppressor of secretory defect [Melanopsichium pennsylvanicum]|uniref:Probable SAC1 - recessive suppressor of secretory defect n=2 Tax=Melanopsichium pennsylvanicum TaxID=63383 RepID=A0AAJ4XFF6_9BASI|nr:probable SAC1-recessive suppressor of secretory defect [Melanopsichium pennsylvanicum 4]SNX81489.1 probable SAC1 - recessive suppressor of secretory defect [Melanopsichium pennsylvanicum]